MSALKKLSGMRCQTNPLHALDNLAAQGLQPVRREVWLGVGFRPPKRCAIAIDPHNLPKDGDCRSVAELDVIVVYHGDSVRYGALRGLCGALYQAGPRRLQVIDLDARHIAFLKLGGA